MGEVEKRVEMKRGAERGNTRERCKSIAMQRDEMDGRSGEKSGNEKTARMWGTGVKEGK